MWITHMAIEYSANSEQIVFKQVDEEQSCVFVPIHIAPWSTYTKTKKINNTRNIKEEHVYNTHIQHNNFNNTRIKQHQQSQWEEERMVNIMTVTRT